MHLAALLQFVIAASVLFSAALLLLRSAASRFFAPFDDDAPMSIGAPDPCAACGDASRHKCSRCKRARYCSQACQSKHWNSHKLNCKTSTLLDDKADTVSSDNGVRRRRKSTGFSSISLVPARGTCKVLQEPKKILFPYEEFVKLFNWDKPGLYPCGLINCGNSCFANVVLQCLSSTRPLLAYLLERDHSRGCIRKRDDWCFLCELQTHVQRASDSLYPFSPINILSRLPNIGGNLGCGRQEDAHEFMRFAIDTMQSVCLDEFGGEKALEHSSQETTLIQYIFGGHLQSQVICTKCNMVSNRYENMMDLTVEIQGDAESLEECLEQFTMKEWLDGENMYKCDGCNDYVKAWKQLTIHQAPNILTIALKRFQSGRFGKLNKRITFPENLDLTPYMSGNRDDCNLYTLYAVVVHVDMLNASFFGHYICYTKDYHGRWYRIDDSKVMHVEVEEVLAQGAYMLFYSRRTARREAFIKPVKPAKKYVLALAPDTSEPRPIGMPQFRDTGHERNLSVESSSLNEQISDYVDLEIDAETTPVSVTKGSVDMDIDDSQLSPWEPKDLLNKSSTSANVPVGSSPVKPMQSNSTLPAEISFTECQAMDCEESCSSANKSITTSSLSSSVLEPCDSSKADVCMKLDLGEICTAEEASNLLKCMPKDSSSKNCVKTSSTVSITASSVSLTPDNSSHTLEQVVVASSPSFSDNGLNALDDVSCGYKGPNSLASCRKNNFSRQSKPLFSRGFLDRPMRKGSAGQGNGINHTSKINGYINGHMEIDIGKQNLHNDGVRLEPSSVNDQHIPAGLDMSLVSSSSENKADYETMNVGKNANTNCDGSTEVGSRQVSVNGSRPELVSNSDGSTEVDSRQVVSVNGSSPELVSNSDGSTEVDSRQVVSVNGSSPELVSNSEDMRKMHQLSTNRNTTGKLDLESADLSCEPNTAVQNVSCNDASLKSLRTNGKAILQPSGLTAGFLNKGYKTSGEKRIARKEPNKTDSCSKVNRNEFPGLQCSERSPDSASVEVHSTHRKCVHSKSAAPYMSPGFLNEPYRRPMKVGKTDHTCNGSTELASICQNGNKYYKPVVTLAETNDNQPVPVPVPFGNGSNIAPLKNDLGLEVDSDVGSLVRSETSPAMQKELVRSLSTLKEHCE